MKQKPYYVLLWTALVLLLASFFVFKQNEVVDFHFHDIYFVIAHTKVFWFLAVVALFFWALYWLTDKLLHSKKLTWAHVIVTVLTLLLIAWAFPLGDRLLNPTTRYCFEPMKKNPFNSYSKYSTDIYLAIVALLFGQVIYVVNLVVGVVKRLGRRRG